VAKDNLPMTTRDILQLFPDLRAQIRRQERDRMEAEFDFQHVRAQLAETKIEAIRDELELNRDRQRLRFLKGGL
jgi:outer membrane protein TolC